MISLTGDESEDEIDSRDDTTISSMDSHEEELHRDQEDFGGDFKESEEFFDPGGEQIYTKSAELEGVIEEEEEPPLSPDNPEDQVGDQILSSYFPTSPMIDLRPPTGGWVWRSWSDI